MNNLYFIETDNNEILNIKVNEILKKNNLDINYLITYDMEEVNISDAIIDLDTYSLFNEQKIVLCKNCTFLGTSKSEIEHNIDLLEKYLNNPNPNNYLIISVDKADGKKNIVKLIKEKCQVIETTIDLTTYIKEYTKDYKMDSDVIRYLIINTQEDITHITNELDKLMALKYEEKEITKKDIDLVVIKKIDNNIFDLIDSIISKNKERSLKIYNEMINYGEDIFKIFVSLSNQIRLIYQVKVLKNLTNDEIADKLKLKNVKQVAALRYKIDKYTNSELTSYLHKLAIMDEEIKLGKSIDTIVFPTFIASL
jgi:DNA polymerase-3 subunit delta